MVVFRLVHQMSRLIVTNSALAYPLPPTSLVGPDDQVLPLVERFEEALFMPSEPYDELHDEVPEIRRRAQALSREMAELLPPAVAHPRSEWGHSAWETFADSFVKFSLGPILANCLLAERAAAGKPEEVVAWDEPGDRSWWSGRQMVAEIAGDIAHACGARLRLRSGPLRRAARSLTATPLTCAQARSYFLRRLRPPGDKATGRFDVVFAVVSPTLTPIFERVGKTLVEEHNLRVLGLEVPLQPSSTGLIGGDMPHTSLYAYTTPGMIARANADVLSSWAWQAYFTRALRRCDDLLSLSPGARAVLVRRVQTSLIRDVPRAIYHSRLWRRLLDEVQPAAVVSFNAYNEAIAPGIRQANARGLSTICCQHGIWGPYFLAGALDPFDEVLVFGQYAREMLAPLAGPHTEFTLTGHCLYDDLSPASAASSGQGLREGAREIVLITTQATESRLSASEPRWWLDGSADACQQLGALLVVKTHPEEKALARYHRLGERWGDTVRVVPHGEAPLSELMAQADVLVTRFSTTALEANLMGKPVVTINLTSRRDQYPYAAEGGALAAYSYDEILPTLRAALTDEATRARLAAKREQFLARHLGPLDGHATQRIAARIATRAGDGGSAPPTSSCA